MHRLASLALLCTSWLLAVLPSGCKTQPQAATLAFRNTGDPRPSAWRGAAFQLSHQYPGGELGRCPPDVCSWLTIPVDFTAPRPGWPDWQRYAQSLLSYIRKGQDDNLLGWTVKVGDETRWYHMPWMAYDPTRGREYIHGMTNERTAYDTDFNADPTGFHSYAAGSGANQLPLAGRRMTRKRFETWAFAVFNPWGAYAIGRTWPPSGEPALTDGRPAGLPFPTGTLVAKLLFTTANPGDVGYLGKSPIWMVNGHCKLDGCERKPIPVRLVQLDVAVVDPRAPLGWVFATFAYADDATRPGSTPWDRLQLVGLQLGQQSSSSFPRCQGAAVARELPLQCRASQCWRRTSASPSTRAAAGGWRDRWTIACRPAPAVTAVPT